ncbi:transposase [Myxococcus sp. AM001]|nr:transposase [Myxococcus sp. AM001]
MFTAEYKLRVLAEAECCTQPGEVGALLRREGLYSSLLSAWRRQRDAGELSARNPKKRGPPAKVPDASARRVAELERESWPVPRCASSAPRRCWTSKNKVSEILGEELPTPGETP